MAVSIVESFNFNGKNVRSVHVQEVGQCLVSSDIYKLLGYNQESGMQAIRRLVPQRYRMRLGDVQNTFEGAINIDSTQPNTILLKEPGVYCFLLRCKKDKAEPFLEWVVETVLPREVRKLSRQIEEKDQRIAILNDDKEDLQEEIRDLIANRHVPRRGKYDNVLCFVDKGEPDDEYKYYVIRCQRKSLETHKKMLRLRYPHMVVLGYSDDANGVHTWCRFREDIIEDQYKNHFNLTEESQDLLETVFDVDFE